MNVRRLLTLATMVFLAGCAAPNARSAPSGTPPGVPQPSVTASPATPSEPITSSSPAAGGIVVDGLAKSTVDSLTVRAKPGTAGAQLGTIDAGQLGFVLAGPVSADGYAWYQLAALGLPPAAGCEPPMRTTPFSCPDWLGWVADGQPRGQWVEAVGHLDDPAARGCAPTSMEDWFGDVLTCRTEFVAESVNPVAGP